MANIQSKKSQNRKKSNREFGTSLIWRQIYRKIFIGGLQMNHIWEEDIETRYLSPPAIMSDCPSPCQGSNKMENFSEKKENG